MGLFSKSNVLYEPGGQHHIRITDAVFDEALSLVSRDDELKKHYRGIADEYECAKYEAHDFPVTEIIGAFLLSYELQEEKNGVPENLRIGNIQLGRKDQLEYNKFIERYNARLQSEADYEQSGQEKGIEEKLMDIGSRGIVELLTGKSLFGHVVEGIKTAKTGKSEDVRWFEEIIANYLCGDSQKAKDYLLKFATEFGFQDEGLTDVLKTIRQHFWTAEFAKYNRSK